jgi:dolichol-phosphate mannosyltransferase
VEPTNVEAHPKTNPVSSATIVPVFEKSRRCWVVLPTINEALPIQGVLSEIASAADELKHLNIGVRILIVDDGSTDATQRMAQECGRLHQLDVTVVEGPHAGLGRAVLTGLTFALERDADAVVCLDGDGQHNPQDIPKLLRAHFLASADLTIGSRWARGGQSPGTGVLRMWGSKTGNRIFSVVTGTTGVRDATTSFRVYSNNLAAALINSNVAEFKGYSFFSAAVAFASGWGLVIQEIPITFRSRYGGISKLTSGEVSRFFKSLGRMRSARQTLVLESRAK